LGILVIPEFEGAFSVKKASSPRQLTSVIGHTRKLVGVLRAVGN
jgi:hypothetical protein